MARKSLFHFLVLIVVVSLLAGSSGAAALAQDDPPPGGELVPPIGAPNADPLPAAAFAPTPGLIYQSYSSILFYPHISTLNYQYSFANGTLHTVSPTAIGSFMLPLDLPDGVEIREISVWFRDNQAGNDISFGLCVVQNGSTAQFCLTDQVDTTANGNTGAVVSRTLSGAPIQTVDNYNNSYFLAASIQIASPQYGIVSAQVGYTNTTFLPSVTH